MTPPNATPPKAAPTKVAKTSQGHDAHGPAGAAAHHVAPHPAQPPKALTAREQGIMQGYPPAPEAIPGASNWDLPPFNRWSFSNMRNLFPTADVPRGAGPVRDLPAAQQELRAIRFDTLAGPQQSVGDWLDSSYTDGFMVMSRGRVVHESYSEDMGALQPHLSQSVAKSVVGTLAGVLHGEGLLDLEAPMPSLVPELAHSGYAGATLRQVLDMRSGVRFNEDYGTPGSDMTRIDIASGWRPPETDHPPATIRDVILTLPQERGHGEGFKYRSIETDVVAWALERAAGASLAELLSDRIWTRMGAERDAYFTVDGAGTALADGGFNATMRDYARLGLLLLEGGAWNGQQIIPEDWIRASATGDRAVFGEPYTATSPKGAYSRQWWIHDAARGDFMARGVFGQLIYIDPKTDFLAVKMSSWPDFLIHSYTVDMLTAVTAIRDALAPA
ncbi:CubicO group peptidase, beta-lactamase class C family [Roseovarius nanhaiticus]|uniref:CubicO group peptidase, beta-lactamase class C family n=1 Tax=Roseovarius nanhaiticus TaxID=573024 RepID=A0A1N7GUU0_9RHOB|nr:serine hydrolase [Roseovarius nanhaiticus]SEL31131.1 CubicO group peptidase, beta-lactamase class C family [Roseovarius nanhaiticus]SIS16355.1 CubicO group peptidase, beta-lactamase class C family [Roseovarius nanhaiticus]